MAQLYEMARRGNVLPERAEAGVPISSSVDLVSYFIQMREQYQVFHWQTTSYAQHQAFGGIYSSLSSLIDTFMEAYIGKYTRNQLSSGPFRISLQSLSDTDPVEFTNDCIEYLEDRIPSVLDSEDTDLLNVRDEMLGELNKLKYLLTLN